VQSVRSGGSNDLVLGEKCLPPFLQTVDNKLWQPAQQEPTLLLNGLACHTIFDSYSGADGQLRSYLNEKSSGSGLEYQD
jgi:hypothetical protein